MEFDLRGVWTRVSPHESLHSLLFVIAVYNTMRVVLCCVVCARARVFSTLVQMREEDIKVISQAPSTDVSGPA